MAVLTNISGIINLMNAHNIQVIGKTGTWKSSLFGNKDVITAIAFLDKEGNAIMKENFSANTCVLYDEKIGEKLECLCWYLSHEKVDSYDCEKLLEKLIQNNLELFCHNIKNRIKHEQIVKEYQTEQEKKKNLRTKILLFCNENGLNLYEHNLNYYVVKIIDRKAKELLDFMIQNENKCGIETCIDFMHNQPDNPQARIIYEGGAYYLDELESFYEGLQELNRRKES